MKKSFSLILVVLLVATTLFGCSPSATTSTPVAKGEILKGTGHGHGGEVIVTVTKEGDKITKVEAFGALETPGLGSIAIEELPAKIVAANGTKVDVISGATKSSKALIYAVNNALDPKRYPYPPVETIIEKASTNSSTESSTVSFTNKFGTATTICAHSGCNNYIATSGDTNCCTTHSRKCLECDDYIDGDATYCMSCLIDSIKPSTNLNSLPSNSNSSSSSSGGEYWCMGKNDTCQNKTSDPLDLFCSSCDKNNDNVED